jgi:hypothetical protein
MIDNMMLPNDYFHVALSIMCIGLVIATLPIIFGFPEPLFIIGTSISIGGAVGIVGGFVYAFIMPLKNEHSDEL